MYKLLNASFIDLPLNVSLSYFWCGGFMLSCFSFSQILSGIVLSLLYSTGSDLSFACVQDITQDSFYSWLLRYTHIWGVNFIFVLLYLHIGRSLYYSSYNKLGVWNIGFILYLLMMAEAFLGYVLPWHQMSYWAATVITSVIQSVPFIGDTLYKYIVGGFSVTEVTLVRAFSAHICLAFIIAGLMLLHLFYLHRGGSNNPLYIPGCYADVVSFHSYFTLKDSFAVVTVFSAFFIIILVSPDCLLDPESFVEADPMVTPVSIKPEWYFLAFYAMLRSANTKIGGLILVLVFLLLLWLPSPTGSSGYSIVRQIIFWWSVNSYVVLTYLGACHPDYPFLGLSKLMSFFIIIGLIVFKFPLEAAEDFWVWLQDC